MKTKSLPKTIILALYLLIGALLSTAMAQSDEFWEIQEGQELVINFDAYNPNGTELNLYIDASGIENARLRSNIANSIFVTAFDQNSYETTGTFKWTPAQGSAGRYYPVMLVVEDPQTHFTDYQTFEILVLAPPSTLDFSGDDLSGDAPHNVSFTADTNTDFDTYEWQFGDGGSSVEKDPTHTYTSAGAFDVTLTATMAGEVPRIVEKTNYINVTSPGPAAEFRAITSRSGATPFSVEFSSEESTGDIEMWLWKFGDDETSSQPDPTHVYRRSGVFDVELSIIAYDGQVDVETKPGYISTFAPAPHADFEASPLSGEAPLTVNFNNKSVGADIESFEWDFGDNTPTESSQNPTHTYQRGGTHTVTLSVTGPDGTDTRTRIDYITVTHSSPQADFSANAPSGETVDGVIEGVAPLTVNFTDLSYGGIDTWIWLFGNGDISTYRNPSYQYSDPGIYTVTLKALGPTGYDEVTREGLVIVRDSTPIMSDFEASIRDGIAPLTVNFTDLSGGTVNRYQWDFGNGGTSTQRHPSVTYQTPGTYTVSLEVNGPNGTDSRIKSAYIVVRSNVRPTITITSPEDNTGVSEQYITIAGEITGNDIISVEAIVSAGNFTGIWLPAEVSGNNFECTIEIPTDGAAAVIIARATDSSGFTAMDSIRVIYGYMRIIDLPNYYTIDDNPYGSSGIAVAQNILDLMRPDPDSLFPLDNEIYDYGHGYNLDENASLSELDPEGMKHAMGHFDIYDTNGDLTGFGDQFLGYNFSIFSMEDTAEGFAEYLKGIVHWMSWPIMEGNFYTSDGTDVADEPYAPVAVPFYADTEGYSRWIIANGCAASIDPFEGKNQPWKYGYEVNDITVYGLFLTDPEADGIGEDVYISSSELNDFLRPMPRAAISGKYGSTTGVDKYAGKYVMVADPPEEEFDFEVTIAEPAVNESTLTLIEIAEYVNSGSTDSYARHLVDNALVVNLEESEATAGFSTDADLITLFSPDALTEGASTISWKDIIDPMLLLNEDFKQAIKDSVAREFIKVHRPDTGKDYYIIPFDKFVKGRFLSYAAILVDAQDGHFMQASYLNEPARYLPMGESEAIEKAIILYPELRDEYMEARLVWSPEGPTNSPFYPYWEITSGEKIYHVIKK
ncbi:MAG: PKD domain-containing protein [Candidatus Omnitrophica bacterium]|nr:PKD domain-containing protein [Candidatus Omnitrophota bacterium]